MSIHLARPSETSISNLRSPILGSKSAFGISALEHILGHLPGLVLNFPQRFRAKREHLDMFQGLIPESHGQKFLVFAIFVRQRVARMHPSRASAYCCRAKRVLSCFTRKSESDSGPGCLICSECAQERSLDSQPYLAQHVYSLVSESRLHHKTLNLIFQWVIVNNKLTILRGI